MVEIKEQTMKKALILAIAIAAVSVLIGCTGKKEPSGGAASPEIIRMDYQYEKSNWEFSFHLENIGNSDKISRQRNGVRHDF